MEELKRRYHDILLIGNVILVVLSFVINSIDTLPEDTYAFVAFVFNVFIVRLIADRD